MQGLLQNIINHLIHHAMYKFLGEEILNYIEIRLILMLKSPDFIMYMVLAKMLMKNTEMY